MDIDLINSPKTRAPQLDEPEPIMAFEHERDPIYICEVVMLKAEDRVFCVPKSGLLEHGSFFQALFDDNKLKEGHAAVAGMSEQNPIVLDSVPKIHFHNFLRLIYPFRGVNPPTGDEHWLGILDLATKWGFLEIRELVLSHLEHLFTSPSPDRDPIRALFLCQKYNIHQHIKFQYEIIITSIMPLDRPAMLASGIDDETILQLMQLREKWFCGMVWGGEGSGTGFGGLLPCRLSAKTIVEDHFSRLKGKEGPAVSGKTELEGDLIREEMSRLTDNAKCLKDMERALIDAEQARRREEELKIEEEVKREGERQRLEDGIEGTEAIQGAEDNLQTDVNNKDDIQSVTSDMSETPSPDVEVRLPRLILLHEQKYRLQKMIHDLDSASTTYVKDNYTIIQKLKNAERKIEKLWQYGANLTECTVGALETCTDDVHVAMGALKGCRSTQRMEEVLERLLGAGRTSLDLTFRMSAKRETKLLQKRAFGQITQHYGLVPYTSKSIFGHRIKVPEDKFGEWLVEFKRLTDSR